MVYQAVFFDLDDTLRVASPSPIMAFVNLARSMEIPVSLCAEHRLKRWAHKFWGQEKLIQQDINALDPQTFWLNYSKCLLQTVNVSTHLTEWAGVVRDWFFEEYNPQISTAPGARETLERLRRNGFITGVISNRSASVQESIAALGLSDLIDVAVAAGEVGYWKPHSEIFYHGMRLANLDDRGACVYVGDNFYADYQGAAAAGMKPILFDPDRLYEDVACTRVQSIPEVYDFLLQSVPYEDRHFIP